MQKAIEEAKKFVCTTKDRIVKDAKEFIQNVDWKKVAIGVAGTLAVAAVVVATGGAAAPVLIGAAVGAGISTGTTVVSGVIQGKSPAEIAQDASGAFMWGAIGGAVGGGTAQIGTKALGKVGKKLVEDGVDMAVDLTQTATENGGLTGKDILFSAVTSFGGDIIGSVKTNSTTRNQLVDGVTDNSALKKTIKEEPTIRVDSYKNMKKDPNVTGQAHHLSQDAAFRNVIPKKEGLTVELHGNAFSEKGSGHYEAHKSLEQFWDNYRKGGDSYGSKPSVGEYNAALYKSLQDAGLSDVDASYAVREAYGQQMQYGLKNTSEVPRIPGRIHQKK